MRMRNAPHAGHLDVAAHDRRRHERHLAPWSFELGCDGKGSADRHRANQFERDAGEVPGDVADGRIARRLGRGARRSGHRDSCSGPTARGRDRSPRTATRCRHGRGQRRSPGGLSAGQDSRGRRCYRRLAEVVDPAADRWRARRWGAPRTSTRRRRRTVPIDVLQAPATTTARGRSMVEIWSAGGRGTCGESVGERLRTSRR